MRKPISPLPTIGYLWSVLGTVTGSLLLSPLRNLVELSNIALLYVLSIVVVAVTYGRGPAVLGALLSSLCYAYFFVPPHFSLAITEAQNLLAAVIMLIVALLVSHLASRLKQHADYAHQKSVESTKLYELSQALAGAMTPASVITLASQFFAESLQARQVRVFLPNEFDTATDPINPALLAQCIERRQLLSRPLGSGSFYAVMPLTAASGVQGVLGLELEAYALSSTEAVETIETVASVVAVAMERSFFAAKARETEIKHAAESLRSSILSALSHDLRTPLTALVGMAETVALGKAPAERQKSMLEAIRNQALSISQQMTNLLDMAKLSAGKFELNTDWQPIEEVIGASLPQVKSHWPGRDIRVALEPNLPPLNIDAVLIERVLWNLIENAIKYSPDASPIDIAVKRGEEHIDIDVCDRGPGIDPDRQEQLFELFQRGKAESGVPGVGLGLSIARTIVEAHGGKISVSNRDAGGCCFRIQLPVGNPPVFLEANDPS